MAATEALIDAARALAPLVREHADAGEQARQLAAPVVQALRDAGLFALGLPASLGGLETPLGTALRVIEAIARADGATGWNVMIGFDAALACGALRAEGARALIAALPRPILAASPGNGQAVHSDGGYRLSGRWPFASGCRQADLFIVNAVVDGGDATPLPAGPAQVRQFFLPAAGVTIVDTWRTVGLRGTGSHDIAMQDLFVGEGYTQPAEGIAPLACGPLYRFPELGVLASVKAAVAFGIAQRALAALKHLAQTKTPTGQTGLLRGQTHVQADVARAEALLRAGRAFLYATVAEVWRDVAAGRVATLKQQALLRLAAVDGVQRAAQAVDLLYAAGGATAIDESSPLARCFRDAHVVTAHVVVQPAVYEVAGRVLLGLPPATSIW